MIRESVDRLVNESAAHHGLLTPGTGRQRGVDVGVVPRRSQGAETRQIEGKPFTCPVQGCLPWRRAGGILRDLFAEDVDLIGTSDDWGASKPDAEFFVRVATAVPFAPEEILYVGDRVDNDLRPAVVAGMPTALVRRGPWATIQWNTGEAVRLPTFRVDSLTELPELIGKFNAVGR